MKIFLYILFLICHPLKCSGKKQNKKTPTCFDDICLEDGYTPDVAPSSKTNPALNVVNMAFEINNILSVDHDHNIIGLTLSLRQTWRDDRVFLKTPYIIGNGGWLPAPARMGRDPETGIPKEIWMPKFYIYWLLKMEIKTNYQQQTQIWISKEHNNLYINYDSLFDLYLKCPMQYHAYPFDVHECSVKFSSADFNATRLIFNDSVPVKWGRLKNTLGQWDADIIPLDSVELTDLWEGEARSVSGFKLRLRRKYWKYIFSYYLTSGLFVVISWVSFLVPTSDVNARMALLVTILLVLVTVYNSVIELSPKAREGQTALAAWMFAMLMFVFLAFICHCIVMIWRKSKDTKDAIKNTRRRKSLLPSSNITILDLEADRVYSSGFNDKSSHARFKALIRSAIENQNSHTLDVIIIMILFIFFIVFVILYWSFYK